MRRKRVTLTYGASIATVADRTRIGVITATDGSAFTIENPTNPKPGQFLTYEIRNASGGAHGDITWGSEFTVSPAWAKPADTKMRRITFARVGAGWSEIYRSTADLSYTTIGVY